MPRMTAAAAAARIVRDESGDAAFGCPDTPGGPLYAALAAAGTALRTARHAQSAAHMADGWARASGRTGVVVAGAASGPGLVPGLHAARTDGVPLICLTAGPAEPVRAVAKQVLPAASAARLPWALREAFRTAREGRPGPVLVELPADAGTEIAYDPAVDASLPVRSGAPHPPQVATALELLLAARRPLLLAGGGVTAADAGAALRALAGRLRVPFADTPGGRGCAGDGDELYAGTVGCSPGQQALGAADCVLALGTGRAAGLLAGVPTVIQVDAEPSAIGGYGTAGLGIVADARLFLEALHDAARESTARPRTWTGPTGAAVPAPGPGGAPVPVRRVHAELDAAFGTDACFVLTEEVYGEWGGALLPVGRPRRLLLGGRGGPSGWAVPAALGARAALAAAAPDAVLVGIGTGPGLPPLAEELAVAAECSVPYVQLLLGRDERGPDAVRLAEAYDCSGCRVTARDGLRSALEWARKEAVSTRRPVLVDVLARPDT
ncbi:thiamine pyrophosphate-binding protein [Streptomyces ochraceiscleroticus]|uniref:Thiamine pyrophosphate-binding protein n=1 Tax=Streptomyces ochraceiscleroticus TaxID=47761 RepID=A0ABW1MTX8_9ACTN|nr:thiamine pyrophosphate-binding protein [Streptomyces ochraceiscleroticus]